MLLSWCLAVLLLTAAQAAAAREGVDGASPTVHAFDVPAQPLSSALEAFGGITGYSVLVSSQLTAGRQSNALKGEFRPNEALFRMLAGTNLAPRYVGRDAFTLAPLLPEPSGPENLMHPEDAAPAGEGAAGRALAPFSASPFAATLQQSITRQLCRAQPRLFGRYRIGLQVWINAEGAVRQVKVLESSGVRAQDDAVAADLSSLVLDAPPPHGMAQPVTLLLVPRLNPAQDCRAVAATARSR
ncbi:MAG: hypothetical protein EOP81_01545 [Variovorax sp.]|nr:MAG: hypothetical protein EOP81_01545 [Variovorax sp.]